MLSSSLSSSASSSSASTSFRSRTAKKRPRSESSSLPRESGEPTSEISEKGKGQERQKNKLRRPRPQKIIVLGAGVSGLACSRELRQRGYEVLVVEARSRVGGRLKGEILELGAKYPSTLPLSPASSSQKKKRKKKNMTTDLNSDSNSDAPTTRQHPIDVGGALIHGIENNPIYHITSQMGVPMHAVSSYCLLMDENGWPFDPKIDEKCNIFFNECLDVTFALAEKDRNSKESFGLLFERVCREKSGNIIGDNSSNGNDHLPRGNNGGKALKSNKDWESPLLKWHRANLELPTGASFYDLGHTWNEDEPYGFDGPHAAVESSWKLIMERLADGLDIVDNCPVTEIRVVLPNGTTPLEISNTLEPKAPASATAKDYEGDAKGINSNLVTDNEKVASNEITPSIKAEVKAEPAIVENPKPNIPLVPVAPVGKLMKRVRKPKKEFVAGVNAVENRRFSRRTRNIGTDVRRSSRSTKGVIRRLEYDRDWDDNKRHKQKKKSNAKGTTERKKGENLDENDEQVAVNLENKTEAKQLEEEADYLQSSVVQITLQNGTVLEADALVCTLPLGVLKLPQKDPNYVRFIPSLSPSKQDAIEKLGCGLLNKCAISFPNAFWQDSDFLGQADSHYSYLVLNAMKYTQKPILIFMYGGDFAKDVEDWTDRDIVSDCLEVLKKICGLREIPAPVDYCITRWGKEQYSRMAFTYIPPGVDGAKALSTMSQPVHDPVLPEKPLIMFAGEHTTPYHPSTMHGAFLSGIREAYRFDLYMEPLLNNKILFDEKIHVYKHTFPTKRVYKRPRARKKNSTAAVASADTTDTILPLDPNFSNGSKPSNGMSHSRRRGFGHMTLRNRPEGGAAQALDNKIAGDTKAATSSSTRSNGQNITSPRKTPSSRRSKRSVGSFRNSIITSATATSRAKPTRYQSLDDEEMVEKMIVENKERADQQEIRSLIRALESYGSSSHSLVQSHILPVYGSTRRRSLKHINDRWKRLGEDDKKDERNEKKSQSRVELIKSWEAKHIVSDNWDIHFARISADAAKAASASTGNGGSSIAPRRSLRASKRRGFFDS